MLARPQRWQNFSLEKINRARFISSAMENYYYNVKGEIVLSVDLWYEVVGDGTWVVASKYWSGVYAYIG